jgi:hypothetical protein
MKRNMHCKDSTIIQSPIVRTFSSGHTVICFLYISGCYIIPRPAVCGPHSVYMIRHTQGFLPSAWIGFVCQHLRNLPRRARELLGARWLQVSSWKFQPLQLLKPSEFFCRVLKRKTRSGYIQYNVPFQRTGLESFCLTRRFVQLWNPKLRFYASNLSLDDWIWFPCSLAVCLCLYEYVCMCMYNGWRYVYVCTYTCT